MRHVPGAVDGIRAALERASLECDLVCAAVFLTSVGRFVTGPGKRDRTRRTIKSVLNHSNPFGVLKTYQRSERIDLYRRYADKLFKVLSPLDFDIQSAYATFRKSGHAYRCFCSPGTLIETREKLARSDVRQEASAPYG